jgi:hypothetical protein
MAIRRGETVHALISASFFTTAVAKCDVAERIVAPLRTTTTRIEEAIACMSAVPGQSEALAHEASAHAEIGF